MTKAEIVTQIQESILAEGIDRKEFTQKNILFILDNFFTIVKESISSGDHIELRGFGTFEIKMREQKKGINPRTKQTIIVDRHAVPVFKPGKELKTTVKNSTAKK